MNCWQFYNEYRSGFLLVAVLSNIVAIGAGVQILLTKHLINGTLRSRNSQH